RRRHTRSTRDWSSDVCSSDLVSAALSAAEGTPSGRSEGHAVTQGVAQTASAVAETTASSETKRRPLHTFREGDVSASVWPRQTRSEERRVGKECVSLGGRCRW